MAIKPNTSANNASANSSKPSAARTGGFKPAQGGLDGTKLGRELIGLFSIFFGLLLMLSLITFDSRDPWLNHVVSNPGVIRNKAGVFGSYVAGILYDLFGYAAWIAPAYFCLIGARRILGSPEWPWWRWVAVCSFVFVFAFLGASHDAKTLQDVAGGLPGAGVVSSHGGGIFGNFIFNALVGGLSDTGAWLVWTLFLLLSIQMLVGFSWLVVLAGFASMLWKTSTTMAEDMLEKRRQEVKRTPLILPASKNKELEVLAEPLPIATPKAVLESAKTLTEADQAFSFAPSAEKAPSPHASDQLEFQGEEETDLPPWVQDFEEGRLGVPSDATSLRPDFQQVAPSVPLRTADNDTKTLFAILDEPLDPELALHDYPEGAHHTSLAGDEENSQSASIPIRQEASDSVLDAVAAPANAPARSASSIALPSLNLLEAIAGSAQKTPYDKLEAKGKALMTCLTDFGIQGELVGITPGPVVTMFEVRPAPGVRVSRIANLSDDLALALKAVAVRIQAPVPGTDTVGIEIPNEIRETVCLRELLASPTFQQSRSLLTLALGKDIAGNPAVADLASMPHLLVAGATGAGKSVGINSIILSFLYKAKPDEVRLLLIDPKRVEMAIYADLPHLVHPVVTDMQLAKNALDWAVKEMEQRYSDIARAGVRNLADYNAKLKEWGNKRPEGMHDLEHMPYMVIVIDELADLMMVAAKEVETSIVRLAQLARAAGIHLILATQRPSVDVVTGIIKANFPCRIAFQVTSKHDSRTILDTVGAEHLLGKGDMLFKPGGGRFQRMHGAFVNDNNVRAVVDYWKTQATPSYRIDFAEWGSPEGDGGSEFSSNGDVSADPLYTEAVDFVRQLGKASISLIQRRFRIGFNKAARIVDQMEHDGIIGPADGSKPRLVLR